MPVDSRAGRALANNATDNTPNPAIPVFDSPTKYAPKPAKAHCHGSSTIT
jgi:hypothetical protein